MKKELREGANISEENLSFEKKKVLDKGRTLQATPSKLNIPNRLLFYRINIRNVRW